MVELLVVILILAVLTGLIASAVFVVIGGQAQKNTETMLRKLHDGVQQQWSEASKEFRSPEKSAPSPYVLQLAGGDPARAQVIWMKLQLRREFPMSYDEILRPWGTHTELQGDLKQIPSYVLAIQNRNSANTNSGGIYTESAACLLIALENHPHKGMKFNAEESLGASAIRDTDGDGVPEIVDSWGRPIVFFRWGTGNPALDALARNVRDPNRRDRDSEDPFHKLMDGNWQSGNSLGVTTFQDLCHTIKDPSSGAPRSFFTIPVVVSAGKDGKFGLNGDMSTQTGSADAEDNIYSFTLK